MWFLPLKPGMGSELLAPVLCPQEPVPKCGGHLHPRTNGCQGEKAERKLADLKFKYKIFVIMSFKTGLPFYLGERKTCSCEVIAVRGRQHTI